MQPEEAEHVEVRASQTERKLSGLHALHGLSVRHTVYYTHRTWHGDSRCRDVAMVTT